MSSSTPSSTIVTAAESSAAAVPIDSSLKRGILKSMVQVIARQTRSYQYSLAGTYQASAFLVDKANGLFFTAGHAVEGPIEGYIISHNDERCDFKVKYKDPEHDYAILQCPPGELEALDLECLTLRPEAAVVGSHVYLIGNDSGEKVNILRGTISRLDTPTPTEFDSNVELIQASAAGKGGCSGGPLLTLEGEAIGICVSGHTSSHLDWFFPLHAPVRVLETITKGNSVARGTLHTAWRRWPFYECRQLGLSRAKEAEFEKDKNGLLVVRMVIPETEAFNFLKVNDILLSVNGEMANDFSHLENILDSHVGERIKVDVVRFGTELSFELLVHDLSALAPTRILSDSGGTFHDVPYKTAIYWNVPLKGLFVADSRSTFYLGDEAGDYIISSIKGQPTPNLIEAEKVLCDIADYERVPIRYSRARQNARLETVLVTFDRHWCQPALTTLCRESGEWNYAAVERREPKLPEMPKLTITNDEISLSSTIHSLSEIKRRFVQVLWMPPAVRFDEFLTAVISGVGFILRGGLLLVEKSICPHNLADIYIDIDGREILGQIVHVDQRQNWAILRYDAANTSTQDLGYLELATEHPQESESVSFVGIDTSDQYHVTKTIVTGSHIANFVAPGNHAEAIDVVHIDSDSAQQCIMGVIINEAQQVSGFWLVARKDVRYVLPTANFAPVVREILAGGNPKPRHKLEFRCQVITPKDARIMGVSEEYINHGIRANGVQHGFFCIRRTTLTAAEYIQHGDIFLQIDGKTVMKYIDFDAFDKAGQGTVELRLVRDGKEIVVNYPLELAASPPTERVTSILGMSFQIPYPDLRYVTSNIQSELIYTGSAAGSPGQDSEIASYNYITGVNGNRVYDRDSFLDAVGDVPEESDFTIQSMDWNGKGYFNIVRKTNRAFPPHEFVKTDGKWTKVSLELRSPAKEQVPFVMR